MDNLIIDAEVLHYIATHIQSNIRELEGALVRVTAYADLHDAAVDLNLVTKALQDIIKAPANRPVTIDVIQGAVAKHFSIKTAEMKSKRRTRNITFPRQIAMYLARDLTDNSLTEIGAAFGGP